MELFASPVVNPPKPWLTWHPPGNPVTLQAMLRDAIKAEDDVELDELLDTFAHDAWENERIHLGWHQWPKFAAKEIASSLGLLTTKLKNAEAILQRLVDSRLEAIGYPIKDLDQSLQPY